MLKNSEAFSTFSVNDLIAAKHFYQDILGLNPVEENGLLKLELPGGTTVRMYPKPDHEPATFTVLNFLVENMDETVDGLTRLGVVFEHYDTEYIKTDGKGVFRNGGPVIAWFKDPSGNILSLIENGSGMK
jgi:catechol 2,3-dioxygenase-like lactoylglutathione lyase family enzyme